MPLGTSSVSPYTQVSERLQKLGHAKKCGEGVKAHCVRLIEVIREKAIGHYLAKGKADKPYNPVYYGDTASDAFLSSYEWRRVRMVALKRYGPICQCCGASPANGAVMNVDHIKPRRIFPQLALDIDNLQVLCHECNHGKGNWDMTDWRALDEQQREHIKSM